MLSLWLKRIAGIQKSKDQPKARAKKTHALEYFTLAVFPFDCPESTMSVTFNLDQGLVVRLPPMIVPQAYSRGVRLSNGLAIVPYFKI